MKAEGLKCSLTTGTHITVGGSQNGLKLVKALSVKLQKRVSDIYRAYGYINFVTKEVQSMRMNVDEVRNDWFS